MSNLDHEIFNFEESSAAKPSAAIALCLAYIRETQSLRKGPDSHRFVALRVTTRGISGSPTDAKGPIWSQKALAAPSRGIVRCPSVSYAEHGYIRASAAEAKQFATSGEARPLPARDIIRLLWARVL